VLRHGEVVVGARPQKETSMRRVALLGMSLAVVTAVAVDAQPPAGSDGGRKVFMDQGCYGCHTVEKVGTPIGPDLSQIGRKYSESALVAWLRDPSAQKPTAHMPRIELGPGDAEALAAFLASLR
jgi:cytochrome c oxidase subunit II